MQIKFKQQFFECDPEETVLDCLIRSGVDASYSCKNGVCHNCMLKAAKGNPGPASQKGLKPSRVDQNYFLPCQCVPSEALEIVEPNESLIRFKTTLRSTDSLTPEIFRIRLDKPKDYHYKAGQFLSVYHPNGAIRNYSIASLPELDYIELHVRRIAGGVVSTWLCSLQATDRVNIGEAMGDCYYQETDSQRPLLLMATGCGMAPIYAVLLDAIKQRHQGSIHVYHGSSSKNGVYLIDEIRELSQRYAVDYHVSLSQPDPEDQDSITPGIELGRVTDLAFKRHPSMKNWGVYLCGGESFIKSSQRSAFLAGASISDIHSDAFVPST